MEPITLQDGTQLDPKVVKVMRAIGHVESGGDYNAVGDSGRSKGAYQWHDDNWKNSAQQILGDENAPMTPENQNKVAYHQIKAYKDAGRTPEEIAALWNGAHKDKNTGLYAYNNPEYGVKFRNAVRGGSSDSSSSNTDENGYSTTAAFTNAPNAENSGQSQEQEQGLGDKIKGRLSDASKALSGAATGQINPISGILQTLGAGAGAVNDTVQSGIEHIPLVGGLVKGAENLIGQGVGKLAQTGVGQSVVGGIGDFAKAHPELSGDIGAIGNIVGTAGLAEGAGAVKDVVGGAIGKAIGRDALAATIADVAPKMTASKLAKAGAKKGFIKSALTGTIETAEDPAVRSVAQTVEEAIPKFQKLGTFAEKVNAVRDAIVSTAKELKSNLTSGEILPILTEDDIGLLEKSIAEKLNTPAARILTGNAEGTAKDILEQFKSYLPKNGDVTMADLLEARQKLDGWMEGLRGQGIFDPARENATSVALRSVRQSVHDVIDSRVPDANLRALLRKQSLLYDAKDALAQKAAKEVGTTRFGRFVGKYPKTTGLIKTAAKKGVEGLVGYEVVKKATE